MGILFGWSLGFVSVKVYAALIGRCIGASIDVSCSNLLEFASQLSWGLMKAAQVGVMPITKAGAANEHLLSKDKDI